MKFYLNLFVLIISSFCSTQLFSLEYGIAAKNKKLKPITKVFVIGERCSGTNFLNSLICQNSALIDAPLGHKHFPPWYQLGAEYYTGNPQYYHFNDTEDQLFVIIFRNPYDWVRSFHLQPHHCDPSLKKIPFSQFIRTEWKYFPQAKDIMTEIPKNPFFDLNPETGLPFENVLALRSAKIRSMLKIKDRAQNVYYIKYETVRDHPQEVLNEISRLFKVKLNAEYTPIVSNKGYNKREYIPKQYKPIAQEDLEYINSQLDAKLEKKIKYELIQNADEVDPKIPIP